MMQGTQNWCSVTTWGIGWQGGSEGRGKIYAYGKFMVMYGRDRPNIVIILQLQYI